MMVQALLLVSTAVFWILARVFQPIPPWAVRTMWVAVIGVMIVPYLVGVPGLVMEEVLLPACAGLAAGEWVAGMVLSRRKKHQRAARSRRGKHR